MHLFYFCQFIQKGSLLFTLALIPWEPSEGYVLSKHRNDAGNGYYNPP